MKFAGVITAAGLSSRMKDFKPLMELNGFPMIVMTVQSMRNAGIRDITVVTGYRAEEVGAVLAPLGVRAVENREYASTDMLASVKLGLREIHDGDGVFLLPGDIPLTAPASFRKMAERIQRVPAGIQALIPTMKGKQTHPPFLFSEGVRNVLNYEGSRGLRGAWEELPVEEMEIADEGSLKDADFRKEFEELQNYARRHKGISRGLCEKFYEEVSLPEHIRAHCLAVGELAGWMAETLTVHGAFLDIELCRSGGYLHDLLRLEPFHEKAAGVFLRERGYLALAEVVEKHKGFEEEPETICQEAAIVCLADKLIQEEKRVSLEIRYAKALQQKTVKERILRDIRICSRLAKEFEVMTGEKLCPAYLSE